MEAAHPERFSSEICRCPCEGPAIMYRPNLPQIRGDMQPHFLELGFRTKSGQFGQHKAQTPEAATGCWLETQLTSVLCPHIPRWSN